MEGSLPPLLALQGLYLATGVGLLPLFRAARSWSQLVARIGLAYLVGVAAVGILSAHLAIVGFGLDLADVAVVAVVSLSLGGIRLVRHGEPSRWALARPRPAWLITAGALVGTAVVLGNAARALAVRPLLEWDGWAIWAMKARALYDFGGAESAVFASQSYAPLHLDYPLLFPSLEATAFRAMGAFDGTLVHVQLAFLAIGFAAALWGLLAGRVAGEILAPAILALVAAPPLLILLSSNMADVPLAFFVGLGVAALGRWLVSEEGWALALAALFLGAAALTKNEGAMFAAAAYVAVAVVLLPRSRTRLRPFALAVLGTAVVLAPWRAFTAAHGLENTDYSLSDLFDPGYLREHSDRVRPAAEELWAQIGLTRWGYLVLLFAIGVLAALLVRRFALAGFAALWACLSFAGLLVVYWISVLELDEHLLFSADRTIASIVIGAGALAPLLAGEAWRLEQLDRSTAAVPVADGTVPDPAQ